MYDYINVMLAMLYMSHGLKSYLKFSLQVKHPSALDKFEKIIDAATGKRIAIFLDYDGTLSPIVEDPECAFISDEVHSRHTSFLFCY